MIYELSECQGKHSRDKFMKKKKEKENILSGDTNLKYYRG